jgi:hypothetical protein
MSRKIRILASSLLGLSLAGTAVAADTTTAAPVVRAPAVAHAEAALERARTSNSTSKVGPLVMAQRNQLGDLIDQAKAGKTIDPGAIDALISSVGH